MIIIDPEFKSLIPPLATEEYSGLEASVISDGCRDALIVWGGILIDGHNRYEICTRNEIKFKTVQKEFTNREDVIDWIYSNQLSRRNLTDQSRKYLMGKQYSSRKKREGEHRGNQYTKMELAQNDPVPNTAEKIGKERGVSAPTVKRAEEYSKAIDIIGDKCGDEIKQQILTGEIQTTQKEVVLLAKTPDKLTPGLFTSETEEWYTPKEILDAVYETFGDNLTTDPCSPIGNQNVKAQTYYTQVDDGLKQSWKGNVFMNPPYGNVIGSWTAKAINEYLSGDADEIIILVPARTDTVWFQELISYPWCAVKGRLRFSESKNSAPFPSAIFYLGENVKVFFENFERFGPIFRKMDRLEADIS